MKEQLERIEARMRVVKEALIASTLISNGGPTNDELARHRDLSDLLDALTQERNEIVCQGMGLHGDSITAQERDDRADAIAALIASGVMKRRENDLRDAERRAEANFDELEEELSR